MHDSQWKCDVRIQIAEARHTGEDGHSFVAAAQAMRHGLTSDALMVDVKRGDRVRVTLPAWTEGVVVSSSPKDAAHLVLPCAGATSAIAGASALRWRPGNALLASGALGGGSGADDARRALFVDESALAKDVDDEFFRAVTLKVGGKQMKVRCKITEIHEPSTPDGERLFDLSPLDDDLSKEEQEKPIKWERVSLREEFSRAPGSRVRVLFSERWGTLEGEVLRVHVRRVELLFRNASHPDNLTTMRTCIFPIVPTAERAELASVYCAGRV